MEIVACISSNGGLGYFDGRLLFHIKEDLKRFKEITQGSVVVMGRKTFESIIELNGEPLKNRTSVVLTRNKEYKSTHGEIVFHDVNSIINHCQTLGDGDKKVYVLGGSEIYNQLIPHVTQINMTHVNKHIEDAEVFYNIDLQESEGFISVGESEEFYSEDYDAYYKFVTYRKSDN